MEQIHIHIHAHAQQREERERDREREQDPSRAASFLGRRKRTRNSSQRTLHTKNVDSPHRGQSVGLHLKYTVFVAFQIERTEQSKNASTRIRVDERVNCYCSKK